MDFFFLRFLGSLSAIISFIILKGYCSLFTVNYLCFCALNLYLILTCML